MRRLSSGFAAAGVLLGAAALTAAGPTPTPTPRPRLSGGFGRTPAPPPAAGGDGQSLEDVVKAARSPRSGKESKPVAITNDSLVKDPTRGRLSTSQVRTPQPAPAGARVIPTLVPTAGAALAGPSPTASAPAEDEATWRERARSARRRVEELKAEVAQLEADTKQLENDFYRWDDGQYRERVIKPAWDKKREDLETRRRQLVDAEAELADLPEKARKAGALPGWLRE